MLFIGFVLLPAVYGLWISLFDYNYLLPGKPFVGLQNYIDLFTPGTRDSGHFWKSMEATGIFTVLSVPFLLVVPLGVALLLNRAFPGRTFFRAAFFAPYVLGVAVIGVLWRFILEPTIGVVNYYLGLLHLPQPAWTTSEPWVWVMLVGVTVWWTLGFNSIIYLAGLQDIPGDLYEAASVDGASKWQQFRYVTLPGSAAGAALRADRDSARLGEHVRAGLHHDPGCAQQRHPDGDHVHRGDRSAPEPSGSGGGDGLHPRRGPGPHQHRELQAVP